MENTSLKILMIEDDKNISTQMQGLLEAQNHYVRVIHNGGIALTELEHIKSNDFDVILLDLMLPGANGWQLLSKIRSLNELTNTAVIMLTGIDDDSVEARAFYDGADDFVNKPCSMTVLLARIKSILKRKKKAFQDINFEVPEYENYKPELSEREQEILVFVIKGMNNKEISEKAFISENTVMNHIKSIKRKLKAKNRIHIAIIAMNYGLIPESE